MLNSSHKPPSNPIQAAHSIIARLTDDEPTAVVLGHKGALEGGPATMASLTSAQRKASAVKAAHARWRMNAEKV